MPGAITQQPLQANAVVRRNADTGIDRETAVLAGQHVFCVTALQQAAPEFDAVVKSDCY